VRDRTSRLDASDKAIGRAEPPHPDPLPQGERGPETLVAQCLTANLTVLDLIQPRKGRHWVAWRRQPLGAFRGVMGFRGAKPPFSV